MATTRQGQPAGGVAQRGSGAAGAGAGVAALSQTPCMAAQKLAYKPEISLQSQDRESAPPYAF